MAKRKLLLSLLILSSFPVFAQSYTPAIKKGSVLSYKVTSRSSGQTAVIVLNIASLKDTMKINWNLPGTATGIFEITPKALQSGTKLAVNEPAEDGVTLLNDNETLLSLSKDCFSSLVNTKSFVLNGFTYYLKPDTSGFKINDKAANVYYATDIKGKHQLWILNDPLFPLVCKAIKATRAIDFELAELQEN
jgi:hypothetical protein